MGASRKLQGEIDRVLKKVQEGVDVFDSIWNKVYDTENANQKEKFEADLKKEIKKLQRYRDQIKSWIQSSEIKDKKALMDARKLIEREMERFKVCEKETKTKAFSKEGLGQQPKTDPREKAKSETRDWLNNFVSDLENQIDTFEAEIEGLSIKKGKNRPPRLTHLEKSITRHKAHIKKLESILRLLDNDELSPEQVNDVRDFIEDYVERNQDDFDEFSDVEDLYTTLPVEKVEALEDMVSSLGPVTLAKGAAPVSTAKSSVASSSVQVTIPPTPSQDGTEDPSVPSLEDKTSPSSEPSVPRTPPAKTSHTSSPVLTPSPVPSPRTNSSVPVFSRSNSNSDAPAPAVVKDDDVSIKKAAPAVAVKPAVPPGLTLGNPALKTVMSGGDGANSPRSPMGNRVGMGSDVAGSGAADGVAGGARVLATATATAQPVVAVSAAAAAQWRPQTPAVTFPPQNETMRGRAEIAPDQREQYVQRLQQVQQAKQQQQQQQQNNNNNNIINVTMPPNITPSQKPTAFPASSSASQAQTQAQQNLLMQQFVTQNLPNSSAQGVTLQTTDSSKTEEQPLQQQDDMSPKSNTNSRISEEDLIKSPRPGSSSMEGQLADLSPGQPLPQPTNQVNLGVIGRRSATSAPAEDSFDQVNALQLLEAAFYKLPQAKDSERAKTYVPRHPIVTPASYPQVQSPTVSNPALWERLAYDSLGTDTLFFAFYYQQNSYQQYLAARELKKNSWRYHRKYNTWFQRHEEPKVTTDEFEKGSYVYFDFHVTDDSSGWCQRIKNEFVFEYNYLEDELAV